MKVFEKSSKINFVDENNVFVGYDTHQSCCENADWFISRGKINKAFNNGAGKFNYNLTNYVFDASYFEIVDAVDCNEGGMVRFRLTSKNEEDLYLHLFNAHNGYYGHGFTMEIDGKVIKNFSI